MHRRRARATSIPLRSHHIDQCDPQAANLAWARLTASLQIIPVPIRLLRTRDTSAPCPASPSRPSLSIKPAIFRSVLDGYVAGGGALPPSGPSWFVFMIGCWLGHTRWNILRCLAGVEASTGPDLALSHEAVRNGVRGLPDLFGRLPELGALLV
jgi:hypothetical protein